MKFMEENDFDSLDGLLSEDRLENLGFKQVSKDKSLFKIRIHDSDPRKILYGYYKRVSVETYGERSTFTKDGLR